MLLTFIKNILFYKKRTYHYFFIYWVKACLYITIGWTPSRDVLIRWKVKQAIYQHWYSTKHDALSQSRDSWVIIILRLAQKWNCLTLAHNETILSSLSFSLCWGLFSSNRFYPSASFLLCFLPHSLTRKKVDLSNSSVSRRDTYHWIGCHLNSGLEMIVAFVLLSLSYIVSVLMIGSLQQTIERWQNLKGQELSIAAKCFVTFTFGPPDISIKTEFRPWSNLNTRLFESSSLHWKKKSKDKNNKNTKNKTDVNPYRIFWSQWQFILFLS